MIYVDKCASPLGGITMAGKAEALTGLWFDGQKYFGGQKKLSEAQDVSALEEEKKPPVFRATKRWLDIYFQGKEPDFLPPLLLEGTPFQKDVWEILLSIPYGKTMTYGEIADRMAAKMGRSHMSAQAVGGAVGHNPISIIVPCHRVVGAKGSLTGYAGGIEKKAALLSLERTF